MGVLTRIGHALADHAARSGGIAFQTSTAASPQRAAVDAGRASENCPPEAAGTFTGRPGAGQRANDCLFLDWPDHRCVNESGQPSNQVCIATYYRTHRLPKEVA